MLHLLCILGLEMDFVENIERLVEPALSDMGYEVVRIELRGTKGKTLQIMIDHLDRQPVTIENCTQASHTISAILEVEDPLASPYALEVSSPGMDRPLVKIGDFERFAGENIRFDLRYPVEGRSKFQGLLKGVNQKRVLVTLENEEEPSEFEYCDIKKASIIPGYE